MKKQTKHAQEAPQAKQHAAPVILPMTETERLIEKIKVNPFEVKGLPMTDFEQVAYMAEEHLWDKVMSLLTDEGRALLIEHSILSHACGLPADQRTPANIAEMEAGILLAWRKA